MAQQPLEAVPPPPDAWDEAEEDTLLARVQGTVLRDDSEAEIRRRDAALLRDTEAMISRAMEVPGERRMLLKLDDQFEKFMGNRELQPSRSSSACARCKATAALVYTRQRIASCRPLASENREMWQVSSVKSGGKMD